MTQSLLATLVQSSSNAAPITRMASPTVERTGNSQPTQEGPSRSPQSICSEASAHPAEDLSAASGGLSTAVTSAIVIVVVAAVLALGAGLCLAHRRRSRKSANDDWTNLEEAINMAHIN
jgi:hypothetical protein